MPLSRTRLNMKMKPLLLEDEKPKAKAVARRDGHKEEKGKRGGRDRRQKMAHGGTLRSTRQPDRGNTVGGVVGSSTGQEKEDDVTVSPTTRSIV